MRTLCLIAVTLTVAGAAFGAPRIWLEYSDVPEALVVSNDTGREMPGCKAEWQVRYQDGGHYTEIALVDLPANGQVQVSDCTEWWDQRRSKTLDVRVALYGPDGAALARESYVRIFKAVARKGIPTDGWSATASRGGAAGAAYDDDLRTRWDTGGPQQAGDWFLLDMGESHEFSGLIIDTRYSPNDYPSGLKVLASGDGENWSPVTDVADVEPLNRGGKLTLKFDPVTARYIKLELTRPHGNHWFWSIHELSVLPTKAK